MNPDHDTIAAPATAPGGAIAVVRISGDEALAVCDRIFRGRHPLASAEGYTVHFGRIVEMNPAAEKSSETAPSGAVAFPDGRPALCGPDDHTLPDGCGGRIADAKGTSKEGMRGSGKSMRTNDESVRGSGESLRTSEESVRTSEESMRGSGESLRGSSETLPGNAAEGRTIDEVLATVFRAPHSYTGEDSVEISCHGSQYVVSEILRLLLEAGARMARPGEFTVRAYLNGKMDLSQAEAVSDLIASSSRAAHALAVNQMRGGYSVALETLREKLLQLASLLELELDFSEEEVEFADRCELQRTMERIAEQIDSLCDSFSLGNAIRQGVAVAIAGAPNVGKSTLLNRLLNEERALVSEIAGTTRDVIEQTVRIDGVPFRFLDTAGIRETDDRLEQMGIERTLQSISQAQIVVWMLDATQLAPASLPVPDFPLREEQRLLVVVNKLDKLASADGSAGPSTTPTAPLSTAHPVAEPLFGEPLSGEPLSGEPLADTALCTATPSCTASLACPEAEPLREPLADTATCTATPSCTAPLACRETELLSVEPLADTAPCTATPSCTASQARRETETLSGEPLSNAATCTPTPSCTASLACRETETLREPPAAPPTPPSGIVLPDGAIGISAKTGEGIEHLRAALRGAVDTRALYHGDPVISNSRHYEALSEARAALRNALAALDSRLPTDLLSEEIRQVIRSLGTITGRGEITPDEILKNIFSKFCIGK